MVRRQEDMVGSQQHLLSPCITADLQAAGCQVSKNTMAAVMADQQLVARPNPALYAAHLPVGCR
jgi:hypothetical protein